ncbi:MAG: hypothetical protein H7287_05850 [Thermoleophilia bacterium]|nr:hypothetical protein [Thermoleophilia bacterium]
MTIRRPLACIALLAALVLTAAGCGRGSSPKTVEPAAKTTASTADDRLAPPDHDPEPSPDAASADPTATLPVADLAGELVMTKLDGPTATAEELAAIRDGAVGNIVLFGPNVVDAAQLTALTASLDRARLARATKRGLAPGVIVSVDQEGGSIRNIPFSPPESTQPEIAARGDATEPRAIGVSTGRGMRALGVSMVLGPVADLSEGPNRTMSGRSFGSDPAAVSKLITATVEGIQLTKTATAVKHFPGFGASSQNSDNGVAKVALTKEQLEGADLQPFRAAIAAKADAIMVSHGIYAAYGSTLPASIEPKIVTGLLKTRLKFAGVAMTDSMNARGFRDAWSSTVPMACPAAIAAGIDLVLLTGSLETATLCRKDIILAVDAGTLDESRVRDAARRVNELRMRIARGA